MRAKCKHCGGELEFVIPDPPFTIGHYQCVECDSTYNQEDA